MPCWVPRGTGVAPLVGAGVRVGSSYQVSHPLGPTLPFCTWGTMRPHCRFLCETVPTLHHMAKL